MKPEIMEVSYTVQIWDETRKPRPGWSHYGQRAELAAARERQAELRQRFKRVRILEHRRTACVVV